jgi:hypothetical protein
MYCIGPLIFFITALENEFFLSAQKLLTCSSSHAQKFWANSERVTPTRPMFGLWFFCSERNDFSRFPVPDFHDSPRRFLAYYDRIF